MILVGAQNINTRDIINKKNIPMIFVGGGGARAPQAPRSYAPAYFVSAPHPLCLPVSCEYDLLILI